MDRNALIRQKTTKIGRDIAANSENIVGLLCVGDPRRHNSGVNVTFGLPVPGDQACLRIGWLAASVLSRSNIALRAAPRWNGRTGRSAFEVATTEAMNFEVRDMGLLRWVSVLVDPT